MALSFPVFMNPKASPVPAGGQHLAGEAPLMPDFPGATQMLENWCWAAVASGITTVAGHPMEQCEVAGAYGQYVNDPTTKAILQNACPPRDAVDIPGDLGDALSAIGIENTCRNVVDTTPQDIAGYLGVNRPVGVFVQWRRDAGAHVVAILGVEPGGAAFQIYDPSESYQNSDHFLSCTPAGFANFDGEGSWECYYSLS